MRQDKASIAGEPGRGLGAGRRDVACNLDLLTMKYVHPLCSYFELMQGMSEVQGSLPETKLEFQHESSPLLTA